MALREVQRALADWIRAPEGVAAALREEDALSNSAGQGAASRRLESLIRSDATLDAVGRLEIYANAYFSRIHGVLKSDYPALSNALGADAFNDLVTSYLLIEPSRHPSLRHAGARMAGFLSAHDAAAGIRARAAWASDLAGLEWARGEVFDVQDGAVLARASLTSLAPDEFPSLRLDLGSWVQLRRFDSPVDRIWTSATRETMEVSTATLLCEEAEGEVCVLIWRKDEVVLHRRVEELEAEALDRVRCGIQFADLCEWAATKIGEEEAPAQTAGWLETWLADGLLVDPFEAGARPVAIE